MKIFFFLESSNKANCILSGKQKKVCHSQVSDEGLRSHLSRNYNEKSMAAPIATGNLPLFKIFLYFISGAFLPRTGFEHRDPCYTCCYGSFPINETQPKPARH